MRVLVTTESRFDQTPDGHFWNVGTSGHEFWTRYLDVFEEVLVLGRVRPAVQPPSSSVRADGPGVRIIPLSYYLGPWSYLRNRIRLKKQINAAIAETNAVIIRGPSAIGSLAIRSMRLGSRPYGIEVVGDPEDVFAPGGVKSVLRPLLRRLITQRLRRECLGACAVSYVTAGALQRKYPASPGAFVTSYSSIDLPDEAFVAHPRAYTDIKRPVRLAFVGSLEQLYKGPDVLVDAVGLAVARGTDLELLMVGDGRHRPELVARADRLGLSQRVRFLGHVPPGEGVRAVFDAADVFVLPSRTEGLPRAMIEAMARGLPCIGTNVGGIPELIEPAECVPAGDPAPLADRIAGLVSDRKRLESLSARNLQAARRYGRTLLRESRVAFYRAVHEVQNSMVTLRERATTQA